MIVYIIEIEKSKFANILFRKFDQSEPARLIAYVLCFVYFHTVGFDESKNSSLCFW